MHAFYETKCLKQGLKGDTRELHSTAWRHNAAPGALEYDLGDQN